MLALILEIISLIPRVIALFPELRGVGDDIAATIDSILESGEDRLEELKDLRILVLAMVDEGRQPTLAELEALRRADDASFARLRAAIESRTSES